MADTAEPEAQATPAAQAADPTAFAEYLCRVVPVLLEDRESASPTLKTAVFEKAHVEVIKKFLGDPQIPVLLLQRTSNKGNYNRFCLKKKI